MTAFTLIELELHAVHAILQVECIDDEVYTERLTRSSFEFQN